MNRRRPALLTLLASAAMLASACSSSTSTDGSGEATDAGRSGVSVVAAFYPLEYVAESVGGDTVSVTTLTPPGVEPHDLELSAAQVAEIASADLVLYVKGFQPAVDEAVAQQAADRAIDVSDGLALLTGTEPDEPTDPHVWLDPANMATIGSAVADRLARIAPDSASAVAANSTRLADSMDALSADFAAGLATCRSRDLVVSHEAFGYLATAFGLTQVGISGLSPEAEPSPARIREVADLVREKGITTIYYETLVDPKVAQTVADETGATVAVLDPLEGLADGATGDYDSVMRSNLATLQIGQGCA